MAICARNTTLLPPAAAAVSQSPAPSSKQHTSEHYGVASARRASQSGGHRGHDCRSREHRAGQGAHQQQAPRQAMVSDMTSDREAKLLPTFLSLVQPLHLEATPALQQAVTSTSAANGHATQSAAPNVAVPCYVSLLRRRRLASATSSGWPP